MNNNSSASFYKIKNKLSSNGAVQILPTPVKYKANGKLAIRTVERAKPDSLGQKAKFLPSA